MNVIVFGSTGRVGRAVVEKCLGAGHRVSVFEHTRQDKAKAGIEVFKGDVRKADDVMAALQRDFDAAIVCIGEGALQPSTLVTEGFTNIAAAMMKLGQRRFIGVSGSAEMGEMTALGRLYTAILRRTPVGHAIRDHDGGLRALQTSNLDWTLAGCNYLSDGPERGAFQTSLVFRGGFKKIHPGDVAEFLVGQLTSRDALCQVVGLWY